MNILHLEASPGWGGQEIRILREAEGMRRRGHMVIFAVAKGGGLASEVCKAGFTVYQMRYCRWAWFWTLLHLMILMRRHRIELVNTHSSLDSWIGGLAARIMKIPIVRTRHLSTPVKPGLNSRLLYGAFADFVVTTCSSVLPMISKQSGKPPALMRCVPTGVDPERMQTSKERVLAFRQSLHLSPDDFLIGTACFMRSWKGVHDFLAAAHILRNHNCLRWVVIGGGHQDAYLQKAQELRLEKIVYFTGHLSNPACALQALDAFVLLSTAHEGISQAMLQAAFLQKPLIATPVGGLGEICLDGQTGLTVPPFSPEKVAEAVLRLMQNAQMSLRMGQNARELVLNRYTLRHTLDEMEAVYRAVLCSHS